MLAIGQLVEPAQEGRGIEILIAAIAVGNPVAGLAAVVEIEHGGDGIDPKPSI
jgi:hypothetical protein